jgi:hypothetical protein
VTEIAAPGTDPQERRTDSVRLALCGGVAAYLAGHVAFRLRVAGSVGYEKAAVAGALLLLYAVGGGLTAWLLAATLAILMVTLCVSETAVSQGAVPSQERG